MKVLVFALAALVHASPLDLHPFDHSYDARDLDLNASSDLVVDLGYERYQGVHNDSTGLNTWKGYYKVLSFLLRCYCILFIRWLTGHFTNRCILVFDMQLPRWELCAGRCPRLLPSTEKKY